MGIQVIAEEQFEHNDNDIIMEFQIRCVWGSHEAVICVIKFVQELFHIFAQDVVPDLFIQIEEWFDAWYEEDHIRLSLNANLNIIASSW